MSKNKHLTAKIIRDNHIQRHQSLDSEIQNGLEKVLVVSSVLLKFISFPFHSISVVSTRN